MLALSLSVSLTLLNIFALLLLVWVFVRDVCLQAYRIFHENNPKNCAANWLTQKSAQKLGTTDCVQCNHFLLLHVVLAISISFSSSPSSASAAASILSHCRHHINIFVFSHLLFFGSSFAPLMGMFIIRYIFLHSCVVFATVSFPTLSVSLPLCPFVLLLLWWFTGAFRSFR